MLAEGRIVSAVAHLADARTQNSGTGILGLLIIRSLCPSGCGLLFVSNSCNLKAGLVQWLLHENGVT